MEIRSYLSIIFRRKLLIVLVAGVLILLTVLTVSFLPNKYSATARLRVTTPKSGGANYVDFNIYYATRLMNTYASLASSPTMLEDIKTRLNLDHLPKINVSVMADSELIDITAEENDPTLSAVIANTVAETLMDRSIADSEDFQSISEKAINDRLDQLNEELNTARTVYRELVVPFIQKNNQVEALNNQILNDQQLYISLNTVYEQNIQLTNINQAALISLKDQLTKLEQQIASNKATVDELNRSTTENSVLIDSAQGDITLKEQEYTTLVTQLDQLQILEIIQGKNQLTIEEKAVTPKDPSSPSRLLLSVVGVFLSVFLGIIVGFIDDTLDDSFRSIQQIEMPVDATNFGDVFLTRNPIVKILAGVRPNEMLESNQAFRNFHRQIQNQKLKTIAFFGTAPGLGNSALATRLSIAYANSGMKVLLLDANFTASGIDRIFPELNAKVGLSEYLNGDLPVEEMIIDPPEIPNLSIIPSGSIKASDGLLLSSKKMLVLLKTLKNEYDLVFVWIPPFTIESDIDELVSQMDGVVVVLHQNRSRMKNVKYIAKQLLEMNAPLVGYIVAHT